MVGIDALSSRFNTASNQLVAVVRLEPMPKLAKLA